MTRLRSALATGLFLLCIPAPASALNYAEHARLTCLAVLHVCNQLADERAVNPAQGDRIEEAMDALCTAGCAQLLAFAPGSWAEAPRPQGPNAVFPNCDLHYGNAVALIDYSNSADGLMARSCESARALASSRVTEAWESLLADEQFCPLNHGAYGNSHESAIALAAHASGSGDRRMLRRALLHEARAQHIMGDAFCAGHLYTGLRDDLDPFVVTSVHNQYNNSRRQLHNNLPDADHPDQKQSWEAYGEGHLFEAGNEIALQKASDATTISLREVVFTYVRGHGYHEQSRPADHLPVCPDRDARDHHRWEARIGYGYLAGRLWGESDALRRSSHSEIAATVSLPLSSHWSVEAGPELSLYHRRGLTVEQYQAGEQHRETLRGAGLKLGAQYSPLTYKRLFRIDSGLALHAGWVRSSVSTPRYLRWFDGADLVVGGEVLAYRLGLRAGWLFGIRQAGATDEWRGTHGPFVSISHRW